VSGPFSKVILDIPSRCFSAGVNQLRKIWILVAGVLTLGTVLVLGMFGFSADGGHAWIESIENVINTATSGVHVPKGGHAWIE